ncbi:Molybdopterin synthase catalytic subunit MoaE [hydrothermal vent metagenome]|uniref:Molybdopterin synthase catalytic subunit MoaE n=1 Tax=hydrothermal vent metagenome TaxID=652676 RepID=A0A3B0Z7X6_9ZZZZ
MNTLVTEAALDPWSYLSEYQQRAHTQPGVYGATAVFVGTLRDLNEGDEVQSMLLEHYPGMTERYLEKIGQQAAKRWPLSDYLIVHRVGELLPGDPIVLVAAWSAHRNAAFEASRWMMEELKSKAPFWKKEQLEKGSRWVEKNTLG